MSQKVLIVLSGRDVDPGATAAWCYSADQIIATDSAGDSLLAIGVMPNHVIGDMDSTQVDWNQVGIAVHLEQSQEATDCDKALALAQTKASEVTLIGVEGNRLDHVLSTLSSVAGSTLGVRLVLRRGLGHVIRAKQEGTFAVVTGQRFSVIPLQPCEGVHIAGGEWNLSDATLGMGHRVSISNRAIGDSLTISTRVGCLLAILETESPPKPFWT